MESLYLSIIIFAGRSSLAIDFTSEIILIR